MSSFYYRPECVKAALINKVNFIKEQQGKATGWSNNRWKFGNNHLITRDVSTFVILKTLARYVIYSNLLYSIMLA